MANVMRTYFNIAMLIGAFILSSCDKDGNLGAEGSLPWHNRTSAEEKAIYFGNICSAYGFEYGTKEMAECIAQETRLSRQAADAAWSDMTDSLQSMGEQNRQTYTTSCNSWGNQTNCTTR